MLDQRIVNIGIIIDGKVTWYKDLYVQCKGVRYAGANMGNCEITILNLKREAREYILQQTNPLAGRNRRQVSVVVECGRESYGTSTLFRGDVFRSHPTQKPDVGVMLKCITNYKNKTKLVSRSGKEVTKLSSIAKWVADDNGYGLSFEIQDKNIASYSFSGSAQAQILELEALAMADVFIDKETLYVKDRDKARKGATVRKLNKRTGLIGIPESTENGMKCVMLFDPVTSMGGRVDLKSESNPSLDGSYVVYKLAFDVSNRSEQFYLVAECRRLRA